MMVAQRVADALIIEIWSDLVCPFCYMGERNLKAGIELYGRPAEIVYRSFQLRPDLAQDADLNFITMFAERRGVSPAQARQMVSGAIEQGKALGLDLDLEHARPTNTRRAHELLHYAKAEGRQNAMAERIFKAYFTEGRLISDVDTLIELAGDVGLDRGAAARALSEQRFASAVDADIAAATSMAVRSVPYIVINGTTAVSGGQPPEVFARALKAARAASDARTAHQ